jgi:hypothetical protein
MYAAFDCCVSSPNLFEKLVLLVCKLLALPQPPSRRLHTHTTHMLASEALLSLLQGMSVHISAAPTHTTHTHAAAAALSRRAAQLSAAKLAKRKLAAAAEAFNREPKALKKGVPLLQDLGIIYAVERGGGGALGGSEGLSKSQGGLGVEVSAPVDAPELAATADSRRTESDLARFFRTGVQLGLDKGKVGEFLGEKDEFCLAVLQEYAKSFAFENVPLVAALRAFLQEFQLPGESQKIDRITEAFAKS